MSMKYYINMMKSILTLLLFFTFILQSCQNENIELKDTILNLPSLANSSDPVQTLGRVLFYDKKLSINNSISCASCHKQQYAFSDNVAFSRGFENRLTSRNSMPIQDLSSNSSVSLFWDGRETNLSEMVLKPVFNHVEMGMTGLDQLSFKLSQVPYYESLFNQAFHSNKITSNKIGTSLASFVSSIDSRNTKLERSNDLSAVELQGKRLFIDVYNCNSCHQVQDPQGYIFAGTFSNIGLDQTSLDPGLSATTNKSEDTGKFKIPSLRNVTLTAPYMHDGRFNTLEEVLNHYNSEIKNTENLDHRLKNSDGNPLKLNISQKDKQDMITFLNTLTDYQMITNPSLSNPFIKK